MATATNVFVCPNCHEPLEIVSETNSTTCRGCERRFPILGNAVPVLVAEPDILVHDTFVRLRKLSASMTRRVAELTEVASTVKPNRAATLHRLAEAVRCNRSYVDELQTILEPLLSYGKVADAAAKSGSPDSGGLGIDYCDVREHVRRDWSQQPECEAEVSRIVESVTAALDRYVPEAHRVIVLGAGVGRFAFELTARAREVIAVDRSLAMAATVALLRQRRHRLYEVRERNVARAQDQVRAFDAWIPESGEHGAKFERMRYVVADALSVPLPSRSVSAVVSIFFTDVVSPILLLAEVSRLLIPGGLFFHFGPLSYHFSAPREQLSAEEVTELLKECGYHIVNEQSVQLSWLASDLSMWKPEVLNWCLSALLMPSASTATDTVQDDDVLSISADPVIQGRWRRSAIGESWIDGSVFSLWGKDIPITEPVFGLLRFVDGRRTVGELLDLTARCGNSACDRASIRVELTRLERLGVIRRSKLLASGGSNTDGTGVASLVRSATDADAGRGGVDVLMNR